MKKIAISLFVLIMAFSLVACGGSAGDAFQQGMKDAMKENSQEPEEKEPESQEPETPAEAEPETADQEEATEPVAEYDNLQKAFLGVTKDTTPGELESLVDELELTYTVEEYNSSSGKTVTYGIAYTEGAALQSHAESGDHLEVTFGGENQDEFMYAQYVNEKDVSYTALLYDHGTWYDFRDGNAEDYSGYYINDSFSGDSGIVVKYDNGNEAKTNYLPCASGEEAIQKVIEKISTVE